VTVILFVGFTILIAIISNSYEDVKGDQPQSGVVVTAISMGKTYMSSALGSEAEADAAPPQQSDAGDDMSRLLRIIAALDQKVDQLNAKIDTMAGNTELAEATGMVPSMGNDSANMSVVPNPLDKARKSTKKDKRDKEHKSAKREKRSKDQDTRDEGEPSIASIVI